MTDKADNPLKESISALVDGEAGEFEFRRVLKSSTDESNSGEEPRQAWHRYNIAGDIMRKELRNPSEASQALGFAASVMSAIEAEDKGETGAEPSRFPESENTSRSSSVVALKGWFEGAGKVAIAASVTFAMLLGVNQYNSQSSGDIADSVLAESNVNNERPGDTSAVVPAGYSVPSLNAMTVSSMPGSYSNQGAPTASLNLPASQQSGAAQYSPELQAQLQRMLSLHAEKASDEVGLTIVPFSRLASSSEASTVEPSKAQPSDLPKE